MASRFLKFKNILVLPIRNFRMSAKLRSEKVLEELKEKNPYFDKYAEKIAKLQSTSPEEFLNRLETQKKQEQAKEKPRDYSELLNPKQSLGSSATSEIPYKKLEDVMKLDLIKDKSADEIKKIWLEYHKTKDVIAATIPSDKFDKMMERVKQFPLFIFPIPREQGYEFIMFQFAANTVHFTPLLCYQVHKDNAPECLNIVHYTEFKDKGIVLMRGEYDIKVISVKEAQCLANQLQLYYVQDSPSKLALLETFNRTPDKFKHMDVIKELENIQLT